MMRGTEEQFHGRLTMSWIGLPPPARPTYNKKTPLLFMPPPPPPPTLCIVFIIINDETLWVNLFFMYAGHTFSYFFFFLYKCTQGTLFLLYEIGTATEFNNKWSGRNDNDELAVLRSGMTEWQFNVVKPTYSYSSHSAYVKKIYTYMYIR